MMRPLVKLPAAFVMNGDCKRGKWERFCFGDAVQLYLKHIQPQLTICCQAIMLTQQVIQAYLQYIARCMPVAGWLYVRIRLLCAITNSKVCGLFSGCLTWSSHTVLPSIKSSVCISQHKVLNLYCLLLINILLSSSESRTMIEETHVVSCRSRAIVW